MLSSLSPPAVYALAILIVILGFITVWVLQLRTRTSNMVDVAWTWTLGTSALLFAFCGTAPVAVRVVLAALAGVWAFRLGTYIFLRNHGKPEDARYAQFRTRWGDKADRNLFWFYQFQTIFSALLLLPFAVIAWRDDMPPRWAVVAAIAVWLVAVVGESIADAQLARFKRDPKNKGHVCRDGLWRYSRHPNYFFECVHWFAYVLLAVGSAWWWVGLVGPVVMGFLLMRLSGIPITEAHLAATRPDYAQYIRTTSPLIPWPPKAG